MMTHISSKTRWAILLLAVAGLGFCTVRLEPGGINNVREKVVTLAESLSGLPYHYGGVDIDGFDCSGFVHYVYNCYGIQLPRTAKKQGKMKNRVRLDQARPGDIVVFKINGGWHTGLFLSRRIFLHAPKRGDRVRKEPFNSFWMSRFKWAIDALDK